MDQNERKPEQRETERTAKGYEVPVPTRGGFFSNLKKIAKVAGKSDSASAGGAKK